MSRLTKIRLRRLYRDAYRREHERNVSRDLRDFMPRRSPRRRQLLGVNETPRSTSP